MPQETQVSKWVKTFSPSGKYIWVVDASFNPFLLDANAMILSRYQGKAFIVTNPGVLAEEHRGYWYFCGETGVFVHFDNLSCLKGDQLWWNGGQWDRIESGIVSTVSKFEARAIDGQKDFVLGQPLSADDLVQVNGAAIFSTAYTGEGTTTISFLVGLDADDEVIILHK